MMEPSLMSTPRRVVFLVVLSVVTSFTVIVDSSEWYGSLYSGLPFLGWAVPGMARGVLFAAILEGFLGLMMAVRVPDREGVAWWRRYHPVNGIMIVSGCFCFVVIVFATWQGIAEKNEQRFAVPESVRHQIDEAVAAVEQNRLQQQAMLEMHQRGNYALVVRRGNELNDDLRKLRKRTEAVTARGELQMWFLAGAKLVMLSANLISLWLIGFVLRGGQLWNTAGPEPVTPIQGRRWTKEEFLDEFLRMGVGTDDILKATGISRDQLGAVILHTAKVLDYVKGDHHADADVGQAADVAGS